MGQLKYFLCLCAALHIGAHGVFGKNILEIGKPDASAAEFNDFGVDFNGASENIARSRTVEHAEAAFLSSSSHRITLMGRQWTRMGVGVATTPEGFVYVVQIFVR